MSQITKYVFDRMTALLGLILLSPVLLIVAILIKVRMPDGPVVFSQKRVGRHGKLFTIYKFRTMEKIHSGNSVTVSGEGRITPLGATLRRYKLDELPELWCVLKGDMSFVGPRPDVPGYADQLQGEDRRILELRPGITGPASLKYRREEEMIAEFVKKKKEEGRGQMEDGRWLKEEGRWKKEELSGMTDEQIALWYNDQVIYPDKVRINLYYLKHYSFLKDIQMILCTVLGKKMWYNGEKI